MRSYVAKTVINFLDFEFYIRPGDLLVHDTANHNRLTVYRNGQIVKVIKQGSLGIAAFLKNKFIEEVPEEQALSAPTAVVTPVVASVTQPSVTNAPVSPPESRKTPKKAEPIEVEPILSPKEEHVVIES